MLIKHGRRKLTRVSIRKVTTEFAQRWFCANCRQSITFRREINRKHFSNIFVVEAVRDFIQGRSSVAVIHERKGVAVGTLSSWIHQFGNACMNPVEIARSLGLSGKNKWSGILLLDAKYIRSGCLLLLAVDYKTLDIVAWMVASAETEGNYIQLVNLVEKCGYVIQALVSDGHQGITALTTPKKQFVPKGTRSYPRPGSIAKRQPKARLEGIPHQWCCVHAEREIKQFIAKSTKGSGEKHEELLFFIHQILFAKTLYQAERAKQQLALATYQTQNILYRQVLGWLLSHWQVLMLHHTIRINKRKIPRDSNCVENVISYVNLRLKTMRKLRTTASAVPISNLIVVNYRTKPLRNTKNKLKRGKSPLELAGALKHHLDWITFIKKPTA